MSLKKLLIIDAHQEDVERIRQSLDGFSDQELDIRAIHDPEDPWLISECEQADLILLDYFLGTTTGLDVYRRIKAYCMAPVIMMTGQGDEKVDLEAIRGGVSDSFSKESISVETFQDIIQQALEQSERYQEASRKQAELLHQARIDHLTGLYNRRWMEEVLHKESERAQRYGTDLSCLILDLDYFKEVNDRYGHAFGDTVLQSLGSRIAQCTRDSDAAFRYGGEEFMILLPQTDLDQARRVGEKIRQICQNRRFQEGDTTVTVTLSAGVASLKGNKPAKAEDLLAFADKALYRAKAEGRNRVACSQVALPGEEEPDSFQGRKDIQFLRERLSALLEKTKKASMETIELLVHNIQDGELQERNRKVRRCFDLMGVKLGLSPAFVDIFHRAAIFHDCTKVMLEETGAANDRELSESQLEAVRDHPYILAELFKVFDFFAEERTTLVSHHENFDGSGYPDGLAGEAIPLGARIFAIIDAFVAMTTASGYREPLSGDEVIRELTANAGSQFDPSLVRLFLEVLSEHDLVDVSEHLIAEKKQTLDLGRKRDKG